MHKMIDLNTILHKRQMTKTTRTTRQNQTKLKNTKKTARD